MFSLARQLLDGSLVTSLEGVVAAIKIMAEHNHIIAEGAGAAPVAAALSGSAGAGKIVCVVSGGNIDAEKLAKILGGDMP
jgi:threonine dehydratase